MHLFIRGIQHQTEPRALPAATAKEGGLSWKELDWPFRLLVNEPIAFQLWWWRQTPLFLAPWMRVEMPVVSGGHNSHVVALPYGELRIQYAAQRKYDATLQGIVMAGRIISLEVCTTFGPEAFWNAFAVMERHQLVARIRVGMPTQTPLAQHYLGRAQSVQTSEFARHRLYKWMPRPPEDVEGADLSPRDGTEWEGHAREARELQRISGRGSLIHITPRALEQVPRAQAAAAAADEWMDNEASTNARRVLPVRLRAPDGGLKVQVFNLGAAAEGDVPYAESCYLRWESFVAAAAGPGGGRLETDLTPHLKLTIHFDKVDDSIQMTQLGLDVREYSQMLRHMGRCQGAKTI